MSFVGFAWRRTAQFGRREMPRIVGIANIIRIESLSAIHISSVSVSDLCIVQYYCS